MIPIYDEGGQLLNNVYDALSRDFDGVLMV